MIDYTWVDWLEALATTTAKNGERYLAERARAVDWGKDKDDVPLLAYGDENIDPMSFLYFLAQRNTTHQFDGIFRSVHQVFDIGVDFPEPRPFVPTPTPNTKTLFHDGNSFRPDLLWRLFRQAAPIHERPTIRPEDFNAVLKLPNVGMSKLTQTLFIANPCHYLPADGSDKGALPGHPEIERDVRNYEDYFHRMETLRRLFPGCEVYEINVFLDTQRKKNPLISKETDFFQISTNAFNDDTDYWKQTGSLEEDYLFNENHYVYTGRAGGKRKYPLKRPKRGDVVLVRYRPWEGRAIGVVAENEYHPDGWNEERVIRVHWINKISARLDDLEQARQMWGFSGANKIYSAFRNADAYKVSFDWIDRLTGNAKPQPDSESPDEESDTSFPLNSILFGPPGTGKTWEAVSYAVAIIDGEDPEELAEKERETVKQRFDALRSEGRVEFVTFHQNYAYEDFIEGIRPRLNRNELTYELRDGIFKQMSSRASDSPKEERHVLVIDEINRGNIAKIFGELITLVEPSKRLGGKDRTKVTLPYSGDEFGVPSNLYLVGTMNTADRGIALLDTALRRRFDFIEKMPELRHVDTNMEGVDGQAMLKAMNERITNELDREHQIGHTYFIGVKTLDDLAATFQRRIMPLLQEYFYDDWTKIRSVLGGNPFICEVRVSNQDVESDRPVLELLPHDDDRWRQVDSYQRICEVEPSDDD